MISFPIGNFNVLIKRLLSTIYPKHRIIPMPALSPTMTKGNIGVWKKKPGDSIQPGDVLVEIETDKANMEFECQEEGYLAKILIKEGTKEMKVGSPLAILVNKKEDVSKFVDYKIEPKAAVESKLEEESASGSGSSSKSTIKKTEGTESLSSAGDNQPSKDIKHDPNQRLFISPAAKALAAHNNINPSQVHGSGPHGRIVKSDILDAIKSIESGASIRETFPLSSSMSTSASSLYVDIPLSNVRKVIAERLSWSMQNIPHYYLSMECNMDRILSLRTKYQNDGGGDGNARSNNQEEKQIISKDNKKKPSINDFIVKAASAAMKDVPAVNSSWMGDSIRQYNQVDVSIAVATSYGLITPIIRNASQKGLMEIAIESKNLIQMAKDNKLKPEQFQGGTFTISNLGMYGIKDFTAIINPPQSCILAIGGLERRLMTTLEGEERISNVMTVTMSCDHRVVDGAMGAQWLQAFKKYIEEPALMIY